MTGHSRGAPQSRDSVGDCRRTRLHVERFESAGSRGGGVGDVARDACRPTAADRLGVKIWAAFKGGFNRSMQRFDKIAQPACRSLVFFGDVR